MAHGSHFIQRHINVVSESIFGTNVVEVTCAQVRPKLPVIVAMDGQVQNSAKFAHFDTAMSHWPGISIPVNRLMLTQSLVSNTFRPVVFKE